MIHDSMLMIGGAIQRRADWPFVCALFRHCCPTFVMTYTVFNGSLPIQYLTERTLNRLSTTASFRGLLARKPASDPGTAGRCIGSNQFCRRKVELENRSCRRLMRGIGRWPKSIDIRFFSGRHAQRNPSTVSQKMKSGRVSIARLGQVPVYCIFFAGESSCASLSGLTMNSAHRPIAAPQFKINLPFFQ